MGFWGKVERLTAGLTEPAAGAAGPGSRTATSPPQRRQRCAAWGAPRCPRCH